MARPSVNIHLSQGGLGLRTPSSFGVSAILVAAPVAPVAGYGVAFVVKNKKQVTVAFAQAGNEAVINAINGGFYAEAAEGTELHVVAMAATTSLTDLLTAANAGIALTHGAGKIRLGAAVKFPSDGYQPTIGGGFDTDVHNAVIAGQATANTWFANKKPFRFFVEGYGFTNATDALSYENANNPNAHIVVGAINGSTAQATLLCLGRAAAAQPQENIGKIKLGSLNIADNAILTIGNTLAEQVDVADLETLWAKRYISFEKNEISSGYVFSDDNSLVVATSDYNNLRHGRVIDNATRIAFATYYQQLKDDVEVDDNGRLAIVEEKALENAVEQAIDNEMRPQLSTKQNGTADVECLVNPDFNKYAALYAANDITEPNFNLLQTNTVYLFVRLKPKGCLKYIDVYLGLVAISA